MGARDGERNITQQQRKKIDDSEGMCGSETSYESFWSRICNPDRSHVLKDVLRGLLVLIVLAIIVTVIFLLCYFLLTDIEKKEDEVIDNLVKAFSEGDQNFQPGMEMTVKNTDSPTDAEVYRTNPNQGNLGQIDHLDIIATTEEVHDNFAPSSSISGNPGENVEIVNPPLFAPDVVEIKVTPRTDEAHSPKPDDGFISVVDYPSVPQGNDLTPSGVFSPETKLDHPNHDYDAYDVINHPTEFVVPEITNECVPLRLPVCSSSVPWSLTTFPNWVNNNNVNELQESLKFFQGTIIESRCSARALEYSCAILEPACGPGGIPLPPCKSFCEDIARTCSEFLTTGNEHNNAFQCNRFPDSEDPNVCVEVNLASPNEPPLISLPMAPTSEHVESVQPEESNTPTTTTSQVVPDLTTESTGVPQEEVIATTELPVFICDNTKFLCEDGSDCLSQDSVCDGVQQCIDNTDELNCTKPECEDEDFSCNTTHYCIPKTWVCDGTDDCKDNSDEQNCPVGDQITDPFDDKRDQDNFVAEASDHNPGVFSVVPDNSDFLVGGGNVILPNDVKDMTALDVDMAEMNSRLPVPYTTNVDPDEDSADILNNFSKFGGENERTFGVSQEEGLAIEAIEETAVETSSQASTNSGERRRNRPAGFRVRRPNFPLLEEDNNEENIPSEINPPKEEILPERELQTSEEIRRIASLSPLGPLRRRRPGATLISTRRQNFGTRNSQETTGETTSSPNPRRRNRLPVTPPSSFESFREASTESIGEVPSDRPVTIIRRRPNSGQRPTLAAKVEDFLKEKPQTYDTETENEEKPSPISSLGQPITIPEQMLPSPSLAERAPMRIPTPIRSRLNPPSIVNKNIPIAQDEPNFQEDIAATDYDEGEKAVSYHINENYDNFRPRPEGYEPRPEGYEPRPEGYEPRPEGYQPNPEGYHPNPESYQPPPSSDNIDPQQQNYYNTDHQQYYETGENPHTYYHNPAETGKQPSQIYRQREDNEPEESTHEDYPTNSESYDYKPSVNRRQFYETPEKSPPPFNYQLAASSSHEKQQGNEEYNYNPGPDQYHEQRNVESRMPEIPLSHYQHNSQVQQYYESVPHYSQQTHRQQQAYEGNVYEYAFANPN